MSDAKSAFAGLGRNFMTPTALAYRWLTVEGKRWAVELSEGEGFDREPIFGVTFRDPENPNEAEIELSGLFHSKREASRRFNGEDFG